VLSIGYDNLGDAKVNRSGFVKGKGKKPSQTSRRRLNQHMKPNMRSVVKGVDKGGGNTLVNRDNHVKRVNNARKSLNKGSLKKRRWLLIRPKTLAEWGGREGV